MTEYNRERMAGNPELHAERVAFTPIGRFGEPEEIADSILWLVTGAPAFAQGINLVVDGGYTAH
jgi:NAD(P)-dependent dehydrogenase (short-subunit alcohol dehydrogenase family)